MSPWSPAPWEATTSSQPIEMIPTRISPRHSFSARDDSATGSAGVLAGVLEAEGLGDTEDDAEEGAAASTVSLP
ncbi:hypothetical protein GCM10010977_32260 [Citricoccus zhacaiensis]|uniref:Uncharacterized protein n=1 Tax=Citricoccus zhacaiensis TaxID=489142 RepID=A0ABQ2MD13_9MICC|nr:hypothetical protein GCM10010977_32260 [Citricoccus zhacaiensis]